MEQARKNAIAQAVIHQFENDLEAATMMARVNKACGDEQGHEANKKTAVMLEKKIAELKKEIVEEAKEGE